MRRHSLVSVLEIGTVIAMRAALAPEPVPPILPPFIPSTSQIFAPTIEVEPLPVIEPPFIASTSQVFAPTVEVEALPPLELQPPFIASMAEVFAPTVIVEPPPGPVAPITSARFYGAASQYLSVPTNPELQLGTTPWTVGGWVYREQLAYQTFISKSTDNTVVDWEIYADGSGYAIARAWNGTAHAYIYAPVGFNAWAWRFLMLDYNGAGSITLQVDLGSPYYVGGGPFTDTAAGGITLGAGPWDIPGSFYTGRLQHWFMFARALTTDERTFLYNAGLGRHYGELDDTFKTGLRAWWQLDEASGQRMDSHGTNHLTDNNGVSSAPGVGQPGLADALEDIIIIRPTKEEEDG